MINGCGYQYRISPDHDPSIYPSIILSMATLATDHTFHTRSTPSFGVLPDFDHPYRLQWREALVGSICRSISTAVVLLELMTKLHIMKERAWEDCKRFMQNTKNHCQN